MKANELLDKALDFIVETQEQNDYICEQMCEEYVGDYCEKNCQNLNKECVKLFLQKVYNKEQSYKANAPEKIYVSNYSSGLTYNWHNERLAVKDIEYTRTDAFIEKACAWLENNLQGVVGGSIYIEDFRKYMEGESV